MSNARSRWVSQGVGYRAEIPLSEKVADLVEDRQHSGARVRLTVSLVEGADHAFVNIPSVIAGAGDELDRIRTWIARTNVKGRGPAAVTQGATA